MAQSVCFPIRFLVQAAAMCWCCQVAAQPRVQIPGQVDSTWSPPAGMSPVAPPTLGGANATLGAPDFDPFAINPTSPVPVPSSATTGADWPGPSATGGSMFNDSDPFPTRAPPSLFPNGGVFTNTSKETSMRFLQAPRLRHTWLHGDGGDDLQIHDTDFSLAFAWPNYLFTNQPLYIVPSFSLHLWDGPKLLPPGSSADLPPKAYSAFLDTGWESAAEAPVGAELGVRIGVFSDFNTLVNDSVRIQGKGLLRIRVTPTVQLRGGVIYADRLRVKLLPAGGLLWTPNPQTRFDIYFPNPKLAQYLTTLGNADLWWYLAAEYGGGSWTIKRVVNGMTEQIDLNDVRLIAGIEWGPSQLFTRGRRVGFFEAGWVADREVLYRDRPMDDLKLDDTFMLRAGLAY